MATASPAGPGAALVAAAYHAAACAAVAAGVPAVLAASLARPHLRHGLLERLGRVPVAEGRPAWFQAASVGEVRAFEPLARLLGAERPGTPLVLSVTTEGGRTTARALEPAPCGAVFRLPLDAWPIPAIALARLRPRAYVSVETEIWPNLMATCARRNVPTALVNGRIGTASLRWHALVPSLVARTLASVQAFGMRTEDDAERIVRLGAPRDRVVVTGNLKFDAALAAAAAPELPWARGAGLCEGPWLALACTIAREDHAVLDAFDRVRAAHPSVRAIVAPRRPEQWDEVAREAERRGIAVLRRSRIDPDRPGPVPPGGILLLDTLGELARVYRHAEVVFVGGSLVPHGGHNLLEPAAAGRPVLFGPHVDNFRDAERALLETGGGAHVTEETLAAEILGRLEDRSACEAMGRAAQASLEGSLGATRRTCELLAPLLSERPA